MARVMHLMAMVAVWAVTAAAWWGFAGLLYLRTDAQENGLQNEVAELWGQPMVQEAPTVTFRHQHQERHAEAVSDAFGSPIYDNDGTVRTRMVTRTVTDHEDLALDRSLVEVDFAYDPRRKGLIWFSLYDVQFDGTYEYTHDDPRAGNIDIALAFPQADGIYDDFRFEVDGASVDASPHQGVAKTTVHMTEGQTVRFRVAYTSRGRDEWTYRPTTGWQAGEVRNLDLRMTTDFSDIDFPGRTLSPSARATSDDGWVLTWAFDRLITGSGMGMVMPAKVQAGPLAASMSLSAPISLGLFMAWVAVLALLRGVEIHPLNHAFVAAAFFSFHLMFGYTADHLPVYWAFALSSTVSVGLTVSYLRLVAGPRFAVVQAGGAQMLYLVGFSLAHFTQGFTGLTLTVLLVGTLFALMQLTGRIRWSEVTERGLSRAT